MPSPSTVLLRTQSDERLVALARSGHERAFEAIVERYRRPLLRACRRVLPDERAEDAVQHTLMAAWTGLLRGDEVRDLRPWLYRIAHNTALNQLRVSGYDYDELRDLVTGPGPDVELETRMVARRTLAGLAALPERQREALLQIAVQGRGQDEVAREMGISEPAVRQLVHRARMHLRAAATALMPMPLAGWLATGGSAGAVATVAKVGAAVVLAGGAAASPGLVDRIEHGGNPRAPAEAEALAAPHRAAVPTPETVAHVARRPALASPAPTAATPPNVRAVTHRDSSGHGSSGGRRGESVRDEHSGNDDDAAAERREGPGDGRESESGSDRHRGGDDGGEHSSSSGHDSGSSGGDDDQHVVATPTAVPTPESSNSGPGSGEQLAGDEHDDEHSGDSFGTGSSDD